MNKVFNLWNNLIKRYSFYSILLLSFIEYNFLIYFIPHYELSHLNFIHIQSTFLFFNIICIYTIYKLEEKYSKFITNNLLLNNKLYNFLLSILSVISIIYFFFICCMTKILIIYWTLWSLVLLSQLLVYLFSNYY